jgi:Protein of unknown function (DUF2934)
MSNLDEAIRERAYHLWLHDGRPEGQADLYWLNAQRDVLTAAVETAGAPADAEAAKAAKKPKLARFRKSKAKTA